MKKLFYILVVILFWCFTGCDEPVVEKPENLIEREKMVEMLADIHLAEAAFNTQRHRDSLVEQSTSADFYYSVLEKHEVADTVFEKSYVFYASQPRKFEKMYRESMNLLNEMEEEFTGRRREQKELDIQNR